MKNLNLAFIGISLLIAFMVVTLGCGSGMMPSMSAMHGEDIGCSSMFTNTFAISHKELGAMQSLTLFIASLFFLVTWSILLLRLLITQHRLVHILLRARSKLLRLHDHFLQQFSSGILHPQIY